MARTGGRSAFAHASACVRFTNFAETSFGGTSRHISQSNLASGGGWLGGRDSNLRGRPSGGQSFKRVLSGTKFQDFFKIPQSASRPKRCLARNINKYILRYA